MTETETTKTASIAAMMQFWDTFNLNLYLAILKLKKYE